VCTLPRQRSSEPNFGVALSVVHDREHSGAEVTSPESPVARFALAADQFFSVEEISPGSSSEQARWGTIAHMMPRCLVFVCGLVLLGCGQTNPNLGVPCEVDDDCGERSICSARWSPSKLPQCTANCLEEEVCDEIFGEGVCAVECVLTCERDTDCPAGTACAFGECRPRCASDADCDRSCEPGGFCKP
jgi:hypothetical protein